MIIRKMYLAIVFVLVLAFALCSCGVSQEDYDALKAQLTSAQQQNDTMQKENATLQALVVSAQKEYEDAKSALEAELASKSAELAQAQSTNDTLQTTVSELENKLDAILDTKVNQYYSFTFLTQQYDWTFPIPLRTYFYYKDKPRTTESSKYSLMATDSYADSLLNIIVGEVKNASLTYNLKQMDIINMVATFTQSLVHTNNDVTTPYDEYPCYPIETLLGQGGDSEDNSILAAAILSRLDYNVVFFIFDQPKHVALGIDIPGYVGLTSWEYQAKTYIYLETTGENWTLGQCDSRYAADQPLIVPLSE